MNEPVSRLRVVVATRNPGKWREMAHAWRTFQVDLSSLDDVGIEGEGPETAESYLGNALAKARWAAEQSGLAALADDSGLEVKALGGEPGPFSSRFLGPEATEEDRNQALLARLTSVAEAERRATYRCVAALVLPGGNEFVGIGRCDGWITERPRGEGGFGYDPIFELPDIGKTVAELTLEEKETVSHRGKALQVLGGLIQRLGT